MGLETLNLLNYSNKLLAVLDALEGATPNVTFLGKRIVILKENKGSVSLLEVAAKVTVESRRCCETHLSLDERNAGKAVVETLQKLHQKTNEQIRNSNFFTRILVWIRECFYDPFVEVYGCEPLAYTKSNFDKYIQQTQVGREYFDPSGKPLQHVELRF